MLSTPDCEIFSIEFVKMWSIKVDVSSVILVGESINWVKPCKEQVSLCNLARGCLPFMSIFRSPKMYTS